MDGKVIIAISNPIHRMAAKKQNDGWSPESEVGKPSTISSVPSHIVSNCSACTVEGTRQIHGIEYRDILLPVTEIITSD